MRRFKDSYYIEKAKAIYFRDENDNYIEDEFDTYWLEEDEAGRVYVLVGKYYDFMGNFIILVFEEEGIVGDCHFYTVPIQDAQQEQGLSEYFWQLNDWMGLEYDLFEQHYLPMFPENNQMVGTLVLYSTSYVAKRLRRHGIFTHMMEMQMDATQDDISGNYVEITIISLDPDFPNFGEDATGKDVDYIYDYNRDEPQRLINRQLVEKMGFWVHERDPIDEEDLPSDGTFRYFAAKIDIKQIETNEKRRA